MAVTAFLEFKSQWQVLPGMAYGLRLPVMRGSVAIALLGRPDLAVLDRAMERHFPGAIPEHSLSPAYEVSLVQRALHWAAAVQRHLKLPVFQSGHVWTQENAGSRGGELSVAVPYAVPKATAAVLSWIGRQISRFLAAGAPAPRGWEVDVDSFEKLKASLRKFSLNGVNTYRFLDAANALCMPVRPVVSGIYCFGTGRHSRWLDSSFTDSTSVVGARIAQDKVATAKVLRQLGFPAPRHARATTPELAVKIAARLGYPVVVKPADRDQGLGVAADLRSDAAVVAAYLQARKHSEDILVEKHFHGNDYRLTVLNGRLIKAVVRVPGGVLGDGRHTVAQLIELTSEDVQHSRRTRERGARLLSLDAEALEMLAANRLSPESVPAPGQSVSLRRRANISAGGTPILVNESVHPDNRRLAERVAAALHLDLAGVDLIIEDISKSWFETGALICEVNAQPQIGMGTTPEIYAHILKELLPENPRVPVVLVIGKPDCIGGGSMLPEPGENRSLGSASSEGVWLNNERLAGPQSSAFRAGRILMAGQEIDAALMVMSPAEIRRSGLPFDWCNVAVFDHPGDWGEPDDAAVAEMLDMLLPHAGQMMMTSQDHAGLKPHWAALQAHGGLELVDADKRNSMHSQALRRALHSDYAEFIKRAS
jgi:cyanophycin synthetase